MVSVSRYAISPPRRKGLQHLPQSVALMWSLKKGGNLYLLSRDRMKHRRRSQSCISTLCSAIYNHCCLNYFVRKLLMILCKDSVDLLWISSWPKNNECIHHISVICPLLGNTSKLISHCYLNSCILVCTQVLEIKICTESLHTWRNWISYLYYYLSALFFFKVWFFFFPCKMTDLLYLLLIFSWVYIDQSLSFSMK